MKLLWVCNMVPGEIRAKVSGGSGSAYWVDHVLSGIRERKIPLRILCRGGEARGQLDESCSYVLFPALPPRQYSAQVESLFLQELRDFRPDVIHIWGTEYSHTLAMVNAAEKAGMPDRVVIGIQGLCSVIERHYCEGIPMAVARSCTFRELLRGDNILGQQKAFALRGKQEKEALQKVSHVLGRTEWDRACVESINPKVQYHFCNETLREPFYRDTWSYETCQKHRIFASSCVYPVKGFHYLLEAFAQLLKKYPDATLAVPGKDFRDLRTLTKRLRENSYNRYLRKLTEQYHLGDKVEILGSLSPEEMKEQYLKANVFALPSTIENSPNSMGEAMLLGTPCVAADVGGVSTMLRHNAEGFVYQSTAPYMLAHYIDRIFSMQEAAESMGQAAATHARMTHDPDQNMKELLRAYRTIAADRSEEATGIE